MKSVIATNIARGGGYAENTGMGSLRDRHKALIKKIPDASSVRLEDMMHVIGGFYCPVSVLYGNPAVHTSNGGYVAKTSSMDKVYVSCPFCVFDKKLMQKEPLVDLVPGTENSKHPWAVYTREGYPRITQAALEASSKNYTHPANNKSAKKQKKTGAMLGAENEDAAEVSSSQ
jgi:hypothetical protein